MGMAKLVTEHNIMAYDKLWDFHICADLFFFVYFYRNAHFDRVPCMEEGSRTNYSTSPNAPAGPLTDSSG